MDPTLIPRLAREAERRELIDRLWRQAVAERETTQEFVARFAALVAERCAQTIDACARMSAATGNLERAQAIADSAALIREQFKEQP